MRFEELMLDENWIKMFPSPHYSIRDVAVAFYRAGLLHAAEQDEKIMGNIKKNGEGLTGLAHEVSDGFSAAYKDSAAMHRQAASEVK